jgi:beta-glucosidase
MNRIDTLIGEMTLAEKLGPAHDDGRGPGRDGSGHRGRLDGCNQKSGAIGNLLNLVGPAPVREMQRLAVEESRPRRPLLIGLDIIHGHRSLFPIPLAEACLFRSPGCGS